MTIILVMYLATYFPTFLLCGFYRKIHSFAKTELSESNGI